jgi:hypothetical protein
MYTPIVRLRFWLLGALALALSVLRGTTLLAGSGAAPREAMLAARRIFEDAGLQCYVDFETPF